MINERQVFMIGTLVVVGLTRHLLDLNHLSHRPVVEVPNGRDVCQTPRVLLLDVARLGCVIVEGHGRRR